MMKLIFLFLVLLVGCQQNRMGSPGGPAVQQTRAAGGVDVGNMVSALVPKTNAEMTYPNSWSSQSSASTLTIQNDAGSNINAERAAIADLVSPNALSLQQYLNAKYVDRTYEIVNLNGLQGVRADLVKNDANKKSDIYLVSEQKDFLHIQSDLISDGDGIAIGEQIISTVRVKYQGKPVQNALPKKVTLTSYSPNGDKKAAYTFSKDCYSYSDSNCRGVSVLFGNGNGHDLSVGNAGYDHGRIVELGTESEIPFDSILISGAYLVAPSTKISIADIYTAFSPQSKSAEVDRLQLKVGYVYLVRTISWPEEDLITKMRVDSIDSNGLGITYQKLVYVPADELQKQVDQINTYTKTYEQNVTEGEVTLHNRSVFNNYFYASFNFQYSTSGNMYISHNAWDLLLQNGCDGKISLDSPYSGSSIGDVIDAGEKDIDKISLSDFPDPNSFKRICGVDLVKGHTYLSYQFDYSGGDYGSIAASRYGAVTVLEIAPDQSWVRFKFRRIMMGPPPRFQKWIPLAIPEGIQTLSLIGPNNVETARFYPFINKRGDQGTHYYEDMYLDFSPDGDRVQVDSRPYGDQRGFYNFGSKLSLDAISVADIESKKGNLKRDLEHFKKGDVIGVLLENFYDRTILVMQITDYRPQKSLSFNVKYLVRAKTAYSDDEN